MVIGIGAQRKAAEQISVIYLRFAGPSPTMSLGVEHRCQ